MSWTTLHHESEKLAGAAQAARWRGDVDAAQSSSLAAAQAELAALGEVSPDDTDTYGIIAVSAAALFYKGGAHAEAAAVAREGLGLHRLPASAKAQLEEILMLAQAKQGKASPRPLSPGWWLYALIGGYGLNAIMSYLHERGLKQTPGRSSDAPPATPGSAGSGPAKIPD